MRFLTIPANHEIWSENGNRMVPKTGTGALATSGARNRAPKDHRERLLARVRDDHGHLPGGFGFQIALGRRYGVFV